MNKQFISLINKVVDAWVFWATTIFLVGYFIFPTTSNHNTFFYVAVCAPIVFLIPFYYKKIRLENWVVISTAVLLLYLFLNNFWSIHYSFEQSMTYFRYLVTICCLMAVVYFVQYKESNYSDYLFKALIVFGSFHYLYGIWEHFHSHATPLAVRYSDRPIDEAIFAGIMLLACFWLIIEQNKVSHKLLIFGLSIPFIAVLFLTKSRGPQLAFLISLPIAAYFQGVKLKSFIISIAALTLLFVVFLFLTDAAEYLFSRGLKFPYYTDIWLVSLHEGFENFWFGQGVSRQANIFVSGEKFTHSHNIVLSIFRMGGIVGVLLFLSNLFLCVWAGLKQKNSVTRLWGVWLVFGVLCLMVSGRYPLWRPTSLWFAYWIPIAFICATTPFFRVENSRKSTE